MARGRCRDDDSSTHACLQRPRSLPRCLTCSRGKSRPAPPAPALQPRPYRSRHRGAGSARTSVCSRELKMFFHDKRLQYHAKPDRPDPLYAKKLQELIGGQWGEMSVTMQYLFQGWNCRAPAKYRDMILDIGTEEIGHVEMLATMVARLLEGADSDTAESAAKKS